MKTISTILLLCIVARASTQTTHNTITLECDPAVFRECISGPGLPQNTSICHFTGLADDVNWTPMMTWLSQQSSLREIIFEDNGMDQLPEDLSLLSQLTTLTIAGNDNLDANQATEILKASKSIEKIHWELFSIDEVPFDIVEMPALKEVVVVSDEFADERISILEALSMDDVQRSEIVRPRDRTNPDAGSVKLILIRPQDVNISSPDFTAHIAPDNTGLKEYKAAIRIDCPSNSFNRNYTSFKSPLPQANVTKEYYAVNSSNPTLITSEKTRTQIMIPEGAFIDASGNDVYGEVVVDYREFRDPVDFILSGIPMSFPKNDTMIFFKSAGMFEINASQNGQEVFLKDGQEIKMNFVSTDDQDEYNFYAYNDSSGSWEESFELRPTTPDDLVALSGLTKAVESYLSRQRIRDGKGWNRTNPDNTSFDDRFESMRYRYQTKVMGQANTLGKAQIKNRISDEHVTLERPRKTKEGRIVFDVQADQNTHPEMSRTGVQSWMLKEQMPINQFKQYYCKRKSYCDVRIKQEGDHYKIILKGDSGFTHFNVSPVRQLVDNKGHMTYVEHPMRFGAYEKALDKRRKNFDKYLAKINKETSRQYNKTDEEIWRMLSQAMTPEEKKMTFEEWKVYCANMVENAKTIQKNTLADQNSMMLSLRLDGMGIFNCDQYQRLEDPVVVLADYVDQNKRNLRCDYVYLVDPKMNAVLIYDYAHELTPSKIAIDKSSEFRMVVLDNKGNFGYIDPNAVDTDALADYKEYTFEVEMEGKMSVVELRAHLGLSN
jgi:hypothetical protein